MWQRGGEGGVVGGEGDQIPSIGIEATYDRIYSIEQKYLPFYLSTLLIIAPEMLKLPYTNVSSSLLFYLLVYKRTLYICINVLFFVSQKIKLVFISSKL